MSRFHDLRQSPILMRFTYLMCKLIIANPYWYLLIRTDLLTLIWINKDRRGDSLNFLPVLFIEGSVTLPLLRRFIELKDWLSLNDYLLIL